MKVLLILIAIAGFGFGAILIADGKGAMELEGLVTFVAGTVAVTGIAITSAIEKLLPTPPGVRKTEQVRS